MKNSKAFLLNMFVMMVSIYLALQFCNIGLYVFGRNYSSLDESRKNEAEKQGLHFDSRNKLEVLEERIEKDPNATLAIFPRVFANFDGFTLENNQNIYPLSGISDVETIVSNESGKFMVYKSDRKGFNNPDYVWKDFSSLDAVLIGDSFVQGLAVQPGEDLSSQLRDLGLKVIGLGMAQNGPLIEIATIKEYAKILKPKTVIWSYCEWNDLSDLLKEMKSPTLAKYLEGDFTQNLINRHTEINLVIKNYISQKIQDKMTSGNEKKWSLWPFASLFYVRERISILMGNAGSHPSPDPLFAEIISRAKKETEDWGGEFYFLYLPGFDRYKLNVNHDNYRHRKEVLSLVENLDIPIIDFHKVLVGHPDPQSLFPFRNFGHYTPEGYNLLARTIANQLNDETSKSSLPFLSSHKSPPSSF